MIFGEPEKKVPSSSGGGVGEVRAWQNECVVVRNVELRVDDMTTQQLACVDNFLRRGVSGYPGAGCVSSV